jgi:hypothetical protein
MSSDFRKNGGYSIIEVMVSVTVFLVVIVYGVGTLLSTYSIYNRQNNMRSIMDNLNFIMDDMTRSLRVGYNYECSGSVVSSNAPADCPNGYTIFFEHAEGDPNDAGDQWGYQVYFNGEKNVLQKTTQSGNPGTWGQMSVPEVDFNGGVSLVSVLGSYPPSGGASPDTQQPLVQIRLVGEINDNGNVVPFSLQSTVSQRRVDVSI